MKLGYISLGLMGKPMVLRLLAAGHEVTVWNRSLDKLAPVVAQAAADLYRLLKTQGKGEKDPAVLVELQGGRR